MQKLAFEKEVLGFYLSDHPLKGLENLVRPWTKLTIEKLKTVESKSEVTIVGLISSLREIITKKGTRMAFGRLEDLTGHLELVIFPEAFKTAGPTLHDEGALVVQGTLEREGESMKILVDEVRRLEDSMKRAKRLVLKLEPQMQPLLEQLKEHFQKHVGAIPMSLLLRIPEHSRDVLLDVTEPQGINPSPDFFEGVRTLLGDGDVSELKLS